MADYCEKRMVSKLNHKAELQRRMHNRIADVGAWLLGGVLGYYIPRCSRNTTRVAALQLRVCRLWQSVLVRRSQRANDAVGMLHPSLEPVDSPPRVLHPYPDARFYATHPS